MTVNGTPVKLAIMNAVHDLPVLVARDEGFFKDEGSGDHPSDHG